MLSTFPVFTKKENGVSKIKTIIKSSFIRGLEGVTIRKSYDSFFCLFVCLSDKNGEINVSEINLVIGIVRIEVIVIAIIRILILMPTRKIAK